MKISPTVRITLLLCLLICCSDGWWSRRSRRRRVTGGSSGGSSGSGGCDLVTYRGSEFHAGSKSARIHTGFRSAMTRINNYAKECKIKLHITSSFRKSGQPVGGAIVTPAKRGNHFVGHAIDFNAYNDDGKFCNSRCLRSPPKGSGVDRFIEKIRGDAQLRWGGDFGRPDPVHIDDKLNLNQPSEYNRLYNALQKSSCN